MGAFVDDDNNDLIAATWESPLGPLALVASSTALRQLTFPNHDPLPPALEAARPTHALKQPIVRMTVAALEDVFAGRRPSSSPPLCPAGTDFQRRVWEALLDIPRGTTTTYSALSQRLGDPKAVRAVAAANARNPISIFIPCHRVIGADGDLVGYAGGLPAKEHLLHLEGALKARQPGLF